MGYMREGIAGAAAELVEGEPSRGAVDGREVRGYFEHSAGQVEAGLGYVHADEEGVFLLTSDELDGRPRATARVQVEVADGVLTNFELVDVERVAGAFWRLSLRKASRA